MLEKQVSRSYGANRLQVIYDARTYNDGHQLLINAILLLTIFCNRACYAVTRDTIAAGPQVTASLIWAVLANLKSTLIYPA